MATKYPESFGPSSPVLVDKAWSNYHGTIRNRTVPCFVAIDAAANTSTSAIPRSRRQGQALSEVLDFCFRATPPEPVRAMGAKWSLSDVIEPLNVVVDTGTMSDIHPIDRTLFDKYASTVNVPVIIGAGAHVFSINEFLGQRRLALQTSGAGNGHRIAGCIATGTHGSAIGIGAVHDTVLAMNVVVAPDRALLVQPKTKPPFTDNLARWFEAQSGITTELMSDDDVFAASLVSLGSLGLVHSVIVEAVPLYRLESTMRPFPLLDPTVLEAMRTFDLTPLREKRTEDPYHFSVLVDPYAKAGSPGFYVGQHWKVEVDHSVPFAGPSPALPMAPSDLTGCIGSLINVLDGSVAGPLVEHIISSTLRSQNPRSDLKPMFPGQLFGATTLPAGHGCSTEIVVDQRQAVDALLAVLNAIESERQQGRHLLGAIGMRFVPKTRSLLGMNVHDMNCYLEIASIATPAIPLIHAACWAALDAAKIPYTCHWGQQHALDEAHVRRWYGDRVDRWKAARAKLLTTPVARQVFAAASLDSIGLAP